MSDQNNNQALLKKILADAGVDPAKFATDCQRISETAIVNVIESLNSMKVPEQVKGLALMEIGIRVSGSFLGTMREAMGMTAEQFTEAIKEFADAPEEGGELGSVPHGNA